MSKTHRHYPEDVIRKPKGFKKAIINQVRRGAIPPNSYDDVNFSPECYIPFNAAERMYNAGILPETIIKKLRAKYKLTQRQAEEVVDSIII